jgi:hypothetical protein
MLKKMLTRLTTLFLVILYCSSCNRQYKEYNHAIIGIWTRTLDESIEPMPIGYAGDIRYIFYDDSANFYPGSYEKIADYGDFFKVRLITNRMEYKIERDRLIIKYLVRQDSNYTYKTEKFRILKLNSDTLTLERSDSIISNFYRLYDVYQ